VGKTIIAKPPVCLPIGRDRQAMTQRIIKKIKKLSAYASKRRRWDEKKNIMLKMAFIFFYCPLTLKYGNHTSNIL